MALGICTGIWTTGVLAGSGSLFCVLVPHFKDEYWLSVGYGLEEEAARQNVELLFFEAGGYGARTEQIKQLGACTANGADAILIGAVTSDHPDLTQAISEVAREIPVFGLVNELHADALSGRIGVDWRDMGYAVGRHLTELNPEGSLPKSAVFISGPPEAGWTGPLETGLRDGLAGGTVTIAEVYGADTGLREQLELVESALERHPDADYLIGSAPAVEAAIGLLATKADPDPPLLLSTYISHTIKRGLMNGSVLAASFDDPTLQGIMAIRQAVSENVSGHSADAFGPEIIRLTRADKSFDHVRISPADYFPAIQ